MDAEGEAMKCDATSRTLLKKPKGCGIHKCQARLRKLECEVLAAA